MSLNTALVATESLGTGGANAVRREQIRVFSFSAGVYDIVTCGAKGGECPVEVLGLREDVIRVEGRNGEDADAGVGEGPREGGKDADEGEVERSRDAERAPAVAAGNRACRHQGRRADERLLAVRRAREDERRAEIDAAVVGDLADGERLWKDFEFHDVHSTSWARSKSRGIPQSF